MLKIEYTTSTTSYNMKSCHKQIFCSRFYVDPSGLDSNLKDHEIINHTWEAFRNRVEVKLRCSFNNTTSLLDQYVNQPQRTYPLSGKM